MSWFSFWRWSCKGRVSVIKALRQAAATSPTGKTGAAILRCNLIIPSTAQMEQWSSAGATLCTVSWEAMQIKLSLWCVFHHIYSKANKAWTWLSLIFCLFVLHSLTPQGQVYWTADDPMATPVTRGKYVFPDQLVRGCRLLPGEIICEEVVVPKSSLLLLWSLPVNKHLLFTFQVVIKTQHSSNSTTFTLKGNSLNFWFSVTFFSFTAAWQVLCRFPCRHQVSVKTC